MASHKRLRKAPGRVVRSDAAGLRRRAEHLFMLAKFARDQNYIPLADNITNRAIQLLEEAKIRERASGKRAAGPAK